MVINTPAKINLSLDVVGKRPDGYHDVEMIMQTVSVFDRITMNPDDKIIVRTNLGYLPNDSRNIAFRAAEAFFETAGITGKGVEIKIEKKIPVGSGLGGGSGNGAGVIRALNIMYGAGLTLQQMAEASAKIGADLPFFFTGGTCVARGLGEIITPLKPRWSSPPFAVIVMPGFPVSTKSVYQSLDDMSISDDAHPDTAAVVQSIESGDVPGMSRAMKNVLEAVNAAKYPRIAEIKDSILNAGALGSIMSGSGSAVFGVFENETAALKGAAALRKQYKKVYVCRFTG